MSASDATRPDELLERGLEELELSLDPARRSLLLGLAALLERWSARINLTGHRGAAAILHRLVLDALALLAQLSPPPSLADLGSGAGFPGLPAAILWPECQVSLVESRERRHFFQRAACRELGLANAHPLHGRAELLAAEPHALVVAQAMARPDEALGWMLPWTALGGLLALPGGERAPAPSDPRVATERVARYRVPCGGPERTLWIGRRIA